MAGYNTPGSTPDPDNSKGFNSEYWNDTPELAGKESHPPMADDLDILHDENLNQEEFVQDGWTDPEVTHHTYGTEDMLAQDDLVGSRDDDGLLLLDLNEEDEDSDDLDLDEEDEELDDDFEELGEQDLDEEDDPDEDLADDDKEYSPESRQQRSLGVESEDENYARWEENGDRLD